MGEGSESRRKGSTLPLSFGRAACWKERGSTLPEFTRAMCRAVEGAGKGLSRPYGVKVSRPSSAAILQRRRSDETKVTLSRFKFRAIAS
jgi:hypothetical protein